METIIGIVGGLICAGVVISGGIMTFRGVGLGLENKKLTGQVEHYLEALEQAEKRQQSWFDGAPPSVERWLRQSMGLRGSRPSTPPPYTEETMRDRSYKLVCSEDPSDTSYEAGSSEVWVGVDPENLVEVVFREGKDEDEKWTGYTFADHEVSDMVDAMLEASARTRS